MAWAYSLLLPMCWRGRDYEEGDAGQGSLAAEEGMHDCSLREMQTLDRVSWHAVSVIVQENADNLCFALPHRVI